MSTDAQVRAAELGELAPEREPGPDPADEAGVGQGDADVRDRRLRQAEPAGQLARAEATGRVLGEDVEDRRARVTAGASDSLGRRRPSRRARPDALSVIVAALASSAVAPADLPAASTAELRAAS